MVKIRNHVKYDDASAVEGHYNEMNDKYVYDVNYPDGTTEQLKDEK